MKSFKVGALAILAMLSGASHAELILITVPDVKMPVSTLTRAEVIADYQVWRLSGLAELNRGDRTPNTESSQYVLAQARYEALKSSSEFPKLVEELSRNPNASVRAR